MIASPAEFFRDKVALVTGAAGVIGREICRAFIAVEARVAVADVRLDLAHSVARELGPRAFPLELDVGAPEDWDRARERLIAEAGRLDILVNNAAILKPATIEEATLADWRETMRVNADGTFLGCQFGIAMMKENGGSIVNMASTLAIRGRATHPAYGSSKAAVRLLTRAVARHCGEQGYAIRVNVILPGAIDSVMVRKNVRPGESEAEYLEMLRANHPIGRLGTAADIASAVLFATSDQSSFMTGADLVIDGGSSS
jgi:NAD(P)-dependent dehydrogenase (short-subunit alcohol dehydrogenase family)